MSAITESAAEVRDRAIAENHALRQTNAELRAIAGAMYAALVQIGGSDSLLLKEARVILARTP